MGSRPAAHEKFGGDAIATSPLHTRLFSASPGHDPGPFRNLALMAHGRRQVECARPWPGGSDGRSSTRIARSSGRRADIAAIFEEDGEPAFRCPRSARRALRTSRTRCWRSAGARSSRRSRASGCVRAASPSSSTSRRRWRGGASRPTPVTVRSPVRRRGSPSSTRAAARSTTPPVTPSWMPRTSRARRRCWRRSRAPRRLRSCRGSSARGVRRSSPTGPCCACSGRRSIRS